MLNGLTELGGPVFRLLSRACISRILRGEKSDRSKAHGGAWHGEKALPHFSF